MRVSSVTAAPSLFREIMEDVPCKLPWPRNVSQVFQNIVIYADAARKFLSRSPDQSSFEAVFARLEEAKKWSYDSRRTNLSQEEAQGYLDTLKKECEPHISPIATPIVTEICNQIIFEADAAAQSLVSSRTKFIDAPPPVRASVRPSSSDHSTVSVEKGPDYFRLHVTIHDKLRHLFEVARGAKLSSAQDEEDFHAALWALHYRYRTLLGGLRKFEGSGLQAAVPPSTFDVLTKVFSVSMECFASPFNCNFSNFCSVFDDIDVMFNSFV
jgi:phosphorylated CTD-interacting factor 1